MHSHLSMLGRYNRLANERLYETCSLVPHDEYVRVRPVSFGSIHALLNHILLGDRIWMGRFESSETTTTPPLNSELYGTFAELRAARAAEDERIEGFMSDIPAGFLERDLRYVNSQGILCEDPAWLAAMHMFNHQTHHRGQIHAMLSAAGLKAPSLDIHRLIRPVSVK